MPKQIVAKTRIKHNGTLYEVGDVIAHEAFTKDQLTRLYERGAFSLVEVNPQPEPKLSDVTFKTEVPVKEVPKIEELKTGTPESKTTK